MLDLEFEGGLPLLTDVLDVQGCGHGDPPDCTRKVRHMVHCSHEDDATVEAGTTAAGVRQGWSRFPRLA